jgi:hypothetical protein
MDMDSEQTQRGAKAGVKQRRREDAKKAFLTTDGHGWTWIKTREMNHRGTVTQGRGELNNQASRTSAWQGTKGNFFFSTANEKRDPSSLRYDAASNVTRGGWDGETPERTARLISTMRGNIQLVLGLDEI